jgi:hypothetical protein
VLKAMALHLWHMSRGVDEVQAIALANLLMDWSQSIRACGISVGLQRSRRGRSSPSCASGSPVAFNMR